MLTETIPGTLPAAGTDPAGTAAFVDACVRECWDDPRRQAWDADADRAMNLYLGSHWQTNADDGMLRLVINRVQNCIISLVAVQAGDPPKIEFVARERGDPPLVFCNTNTPGGQMLAQELIAGGMNPNAAIPDPMSHQIMERAEAGEQMKMAGLMAPGMLTKDDIVEVNDATAAEAVQTVFDAMWDQSDCQALFVENVLYKNILGWQPTLYEFDDVEKKHVLTNVNPRQVFFDRLRSDLSRQQYAVYDEPISLEEAVALYPDFSQRLRDASNTGSLQFPGARMYTPAGDLQTARFDRGMVVIRHAWFRNQPFPMSAEQAISTGAATEREGLMYVSGPDGIEREVTLGGPGWPMRYGIRQVKILIDGVVDDRECETVDIPLPVNVNVPVPFSPYGQGEPIRLQGLQSALNRVISCIVTHQSYNAFPPEYMAQGVVDAMDKAIRDMRTRPGSRVVVPDYLITQLQDIRKIVATGDTPAISADVWKLLDFLVQMIDKEGNQSDVMQGNASASWSGETVNALQNAASQVIRGKSLYTETYLRRLARLMVHSIHTRMDATDWARYCGKWPVQAIEAIRSRSKSVDVDFSVQIRSGSGSSRQSETTALVMAGQSGAPVSPQTLLGRFDLDPKVELRNTVQWQRDLAAAMPAPVAAPGQSEPKE